MTTGKAIWSEQLFHIYGRDIKLGVPPMESYLEDYHPDDRKSLQDAIDAAIKKGVPYNIDYRIFRKNDGEERWIRSEGKLRKDEKGKPIRLIGVAQDITERKKAEKELEDIFNLSLDMLVAGSLKGDSIESVLPAKEFWVINQMKLLS